MSASETPSTATSPGSSPAWKAHLARAGSHRYNEDVEPENLEEQRRHIEPWLSALAQAEHFSVLVGSGLTNAVAALAGVKASGMSIVPFASPYADAVADEAEMSAVNTGRGKANFEDHIRAAIHLIDGLRILARADSEWDGHLAAWEAELNDRLSGLLKGVLATERDLAAALGSAGEPGNRARRYLCSFLLSFASRTATRERLHVFTTNYDRVLEHGCDLLGLRVLDRFVGRLEPVFRASRLGVDLHYNPPGIRGEPRYLEGVVRLTKLHGSVDWRQKNESGRACIVRAPLPFGASEAHPEIPRDPKGRVLIYPSPAKDLETAAYPYAELFRDFAAAVCQPNSVLVTYGYGFGDDHINRVLRDMLTIPSAQLAIISWDNAFGRIECFVDSLSSKEQVTLLLGSHFGDLQTLVEHYLPKAAIDRTTLRMVELVNRRTPHGRGESNPEKPQDPLAEP